MGNDYIIFNSVLRAPVNQRRKPKKERENGRKKYFIVG
jgi:hypothetical protein